MYDICIIGGGAAGMSAAISAKKKNPKCSIIILEKKSQLGRKILATGNGKCNLSNIHCPRYKETLDFFHQLGLLTRRDEAGRIYPYTEEAKAVGRALEKQIHLLQITVATEFSVESIDWEDGFQIHSEKGLIKAKKLLIAAGGKAGPQFGTTGDSYRLAKSLGHRVSRLAPALTAIEVKEDLRSLSGIRAKAKVSLEYENQLLAAEKGEIQFTVKDVSGICVFNLSRYLVLQAGKSLKDGFDGYRLYIDFLPEIDEPLGLLEERKQLEGFDGPAILDFLVKEPLAARIYDLSKGNLREMAKLLKKFPLSPKGARGWEFAQVTRGGVLLDEINTNTMESKLVKNLYFAGEVIDYDGPCGGYNLQNAWETGILAGKEMAGEE